MEKAAKKLTLSKETLRTLNDDELTDVVGGQTAGVVCVNTVVCQSGVCNVDINTIICHSGVCNSAVCQSGAVCNSVLC